MNYQDWLDSIDQLLRSSGRGYGTAQIDPNHLQTAFQQGMSPVIYARQANHPLKPVQQPYPMPAAPQPMTLPPLAFDRASYIVKFLDGFGWIFQIVGWGVVFVWALFLILGMIGVGAGEATENPFLATGKAFAAGIFGGIFTLAVPFLGLCIAFVGVVCWWLSGIFRAIYKR